MHVEVFSAPNIYLLSQQKYLLEVTEPALQSLYLFVILVYNSLEFFLSSEEVVIVLVDSPDKQIVPHFQVVLYSGNLFGGINDFVHDVEQLELEYFLNVINKSYLLILFTQIDNQQVFA